MLLFVVFLNRVFNLILGEPSKPNVWVNFLIIYIFRKGHSSILN